MPQEVEPIDLFSAIKNRPYLNKVFKNTGWIFVDKFFRLLVSLFVVIFIVRSLGPNGFGEFSFVLAIVAFLSPLSALGIDSILARELIKNPKQRGELLGTAISVRLFISAICIILLFVVMYLSGFTFNLIFLSIIFSTSLFFDSFSLLNLLFGADLKSKLSIFVGQIVLVATTILKIYLLMINAPVLGFILVSLFESFLSALLLLIIFFREYPSLKLKFNLELSKKLSKSGIPFMLAGLGTIIYMHADQIVVGYMLPISAVGFYAVAVKLSEFFYVIPAAISTSVFPKLVQLGEANNKDYNKRLQDLFDVMTFLSIIILVPLSLLSLPIITIMYGQAYSEASKIFSIYVISGIFIFFGFTSNNHLVIKDHGKILFFRSLFGAILNVILSIVLVYYFGLLGAAIATLICFAFTFWISLYLFKETRFLFFMFLETFNYIRITRRVIELLKNHKVIK